MGAHREKNCAESCVAIMWGGTGLPLVEPEQVCEACGALGTVGRVVLTPPDEKRREMHRYCLRCWPAEQAWWNARWEDQQHNPFEELSQADTDIDDSAIDFAVSQNVSTDNSRDGESTGPLSDQELSDVQITFESATWHDARTFIRGFQQQLYYARNGAPSERQLVAEAVEIAEQIENEMHTRVGQMPREVSEFLLSFGKESSAAQAARKRLESFAGDDLFTTKHSATRRRDTDEFRTQARAMDEELAAAHASADAIIAEFDQSLESLVVPNTPETQLMVKKELVAMLQYLEKEIASEAAVLVSWEEEMRAAAKSGDAYTAAKLNRLGEDRIVRIKGLRDSMTDVEALHQRLLGQERQTLQQNNVSSHTDIRHMNTGNMHSDS